MKKATITFITSAALAFAIPLFAAGEPGMKSDSQHPAGVTQQDTKSDSQQKVGLAEQGMKSESQQKEGITQQGMKSDSQQKEGITQQGMESDSQQKPGLAQQQTDQMQSGQLITAEKLQGMEVVSQKGEKFGEIKKVMIDQQSGEVQFVTFSKGGILGMGAEEIAAPLSAFEIGDDQARLTVDQSKLENVPQQTAEATDSDYLRDLETHYGVAPAWEKGELGDPNQTQQMKDQDTTEPGKVGTQN